MKKFLWWSVFATLAGMLLFGAVYRTVLTADSGPFTKQDPTAQANPARSAPFQNQANDGEKSAADALAPDQGTEDLVDPAGWTQIDGEAVLVSSDSLILTLKDDMTVQVERGAWKYALGQNFSIQIGDKVQVTGFFTEGELKVVQIQNLTLASTVVLRNESGEPLWSGGGKD